MPAIKELPLMERPREKLLHYGPATLNNSELLAILLGSGSKNFPVINICENLVEVINNQPAQLATLTIQQLCKIKGIGEIKAITLTAAIELGKRSICQTREPLLLKTDDQVGAFLSPYLLAQENAEYILIMLNTRKELLATKDFPITKQRPPMVSEIIQISLEAASAEIILCRASCRLSDIYLNKEKAFIIQLDAAACMLNIKMKGLLVLDKEPL